MAEQTWPCSACGEPVDDQTRFCPHCGQLQQPAASAPKQDLSRTVLGVSPDAPPSQRPQGEPSDTTMGAAATNPAGTAKPGGPTKAAFAKTMMGQGLDLPPREAKGQPQAPTPAAEPTEPAEGPKGRTMLGTPGPLDSNAVAAAAAAAAVKRGHSPDARGRTMLGSPDLQAAAEAARQATSTGAGAPAAASAGREQTSPSGFGRPAIRDSDEPAVPSRQRPLLLALGVLVSLMLLGGAYFLWSAPKTVKGLSVSVETTEAGEAMKFALLDAEPGTRIEFGDQVADVEGGEARFPLSVDSLEVGANVVVARVLAPDGDADTLRVPLHVDYRLRVDTAPLHDAKDPAIEVIAAATPGTKLTLDGEPLALDEQGRGMRRYPIDVVDNGRTGTIDHVVKYRVEPPKGEPVVGELHTKVPISTLQVDSPGPVAITDAESMELAGAVPKGTSVTVEGEDVEVNAQGRFLHVFPLPRPGLYTPTVVAKARDKAPRAHKLEITRVADLAKAADSYVPKRKLTYAEIAQNPSIYKGQRVDFEGRVFNVKTSQGLGVLQMLVRDCAKGRQCSLWVTYPATTRIASDSWVRVLGTVEGEQQFRSKRDEVVSVPKVQALFVLAK